MKKMVTSLSLSAALLLGDSSTARAATSTWDGHTDSFWTTALNWDAAPGVGDNIIFPNVTGQAVDLNAGTFGVGTLTFNAPDAYSVANGQLTLGGNVTQSGAGTVALNAGIDLGGAVPGQECRRTHDQIGHVLAMNLTRMVRDTDRYFLYDEMFDEVHRQGGLTGYAHVGRGEFHVHRDMAMNVPRAKVDFVEILQFNVLGTDLYYDFLNLSCKLTASAGSDVPWGGTIGEVRAYAYLGKEKFSADAWLDAFKRGRTFTTSGPMLELRVDNALPGDEIRLKKDRKLRVRARAWGDATRMGRVKLEIVRHGEVIRTIESPSDKNSEAELDFTVDAGHGGWIAARAKAADGTSAHTSPVFIVREGLRFWKYDGLNELFAKRLASLAEIEKIVADARRLQAEGKLDGSLGDDRYLKQLAAQGDGLLERATSARGMYGELKRVAESERSRRSKRTAHYHENHLAHPFAVSDLRSR